VLMSAYACEPDKGSEPGAGWNWVLAAARDHEVWAMTRANNRASIEKALEADPRPNLHFVFLDLPGWARRWKRGGRGVRTYYALWQVLAAREGRRLHRSRRFDVVHHVTFANMWLPSLACLVDAPFVLGPVGGGPRVSLRLYSALGLRGVVSELLLVGGRRLSRLNPCVRMSWSRAAVILCQNRETATALPRSFRAKAQIRPNASVGGGLEPTARPGSSPGNMRHCVYAGRLLPWKGIALAIRAVAQCPDWTLTIVGEGPDRQRLSRLVSRLELEHRVTFVDWLPQGELWSLLRTCDALMLPSLRDDSGMIAAEASALGIPVVAFDQGGPAAFARQGRGNLELASLGGTANAVAALARALRKAQARRASASETGFESTTLSDDLTVVYQSTAAHARSGAGHASLVGSGAE
jgi:glycosyltransferase involved in cell wall biosynthesis